jgi:DnaJ-class molecular chaperone
MTHYAGPVEIDRTSGTSGEGRSEEMHARDADGNGTTDNPAMSSAQRSPKCLGRGVTPAMEARHMTGAPDSETSEHNQIALDPQVSSTHDLREDQAGVIVEQFSALIPTPVFPAKRGQ